MQARNLLLLLLLCCLSCRSKKPEEKFDKAKWAIKEGSDHPYRDKMLKDLMTYEIHGWKKDSILNLLGPPTRVDSNYLFYRISQKRLGFFPLGTKTLVIKLTGDSIVEWRKVHE